MGWVGVSSVCATSVAFCNKISRHYSLFVGRVSDLVRLVGSRRRDLALFT